MAKKILSTVLVGGLLLSSSAFAKENISLAMSKVYGQYNNIHRCWVLRDDYSYCMKIASVNSAVDTQGKEYVYLLANGDAIEDEGHVHAFSSGGRIGMIIYKYCNNLYALLTLPCSISYDAHVPTHQ